MVDHTGHILCCKTKLSDKDFLSNLDRQFKRMQTFILKKKKKSKKSDMPIEQVNSTLAIGKGR